VIVGRFAPSPTGFLHLGNFRTALVAYLSAKRNGDDGGRFLVRFEDLDRVTSSPRMAALQMLELGDLGVKADEPPVFQSNRFALYDAAIEKLAERGLTYPCFCTRREIAEAAAAPHGAPGAYPGTCRGLSEAERAERAATKQPALRLDLAAAGLAGVPISFTDMFMGEVSGTPDDVVLRRNDGVPSYNVAVVVDDFLQGVTEVVRGDDLAAVTPSQIVLHHLLGMRIPEYGHVPLKRGPDGERLSKRHGSITLDNMADDGYTADDVREMLLDEIAGFAPHLVPRSG
jgi:glutamyl-tRNA synthetase